MDSLLIINFLIPLFLIHEKKSKNKYYFAFSQNNIWFNTLLRPLLGSRKAVGEVRSEQAAAHVKHLYDCLDYELNCPCDNQVLNPILS